MTLLSDAAAFDAAAPVAASVTRRDRLVREAELKRLKREAKQPVRVAPGRSAMEAKPRASRAMEAGPAMEADARAGHAMEADADALARDFARWAVLAYTMETTVAEARERGILSARLHAAGAFKK